MGAVVALLARPRAIRLENLRTILQRGAAMPGPGCAEIPGPYSIRSTRTALLCPSTDSRHEPNMPGLMVTIGLSTG